MKIIKRLFAVVVILAVLATAFPLIKDDIISWYDCLDTELLIRRYAKENGLQYSDYPESLVELLDRNPETKEFVLGYPLREQKQYDMSDWADEDSVPLFLQWDMRWGYEVYGSDVIGITGCGPTCLAMVGYYLTRDSYFTPEKVAQFALENGYYVDGNGSSWTLISEGAEKLGLTVEELPLGKQSMMNALNAGNPIILAMGPGDFTTTGHYIVLAGVEDGLFIVNDPNSKARSERLWSYDEIQNQIRNIWEISYCS